ncbi:MAG: hypothetical protein A2087_13805 [Spirochaetes bacterium GWD1_61_31]|nr:MAG: hypothetical protein A2Y37_10330 [Spirochaetes bacterium GWB1_60_80]OHD33755.1 MAG: hypothetical protein A2004_09600 [Spirochaetes bacterium GWC1_61_12]OHD38978.1 MAG: hypothetical protein A2087_13805 [Spirochaetes bacterium GWD1_61_31]OHD43428.1 MAG: hypothetical protein A2Y35_11700 [Spirochaetes bacterium GWE1_60_18]OHD58959.1 MAG: hypothetical protein A2Y32_10490 [Spirochaetes bacterium GWF1_60_12]HAP42640.1 hypothetical protein [Spirochaetaceae bacterium]
MKQRLLACLVAVLIGTGLASAQAIDPDKLLTQYIRTTWSADDGVKEALDIIQDSRGYIWIGTYDGPVRFDGLTFAIPGDIDGGVVPGSARAFCLDDEGSLWIGSNNQGLARYRQQRYEFFDMDDGLPNNSVRRLLRDSRGRIWVGTVAGLAVFQNGRLTTFPDQPELLSAQIMFLAEDEQGRVWIGTNGEAGLFVAGDGPPAASPSPRNGRLDGRPLVSLLFSDGLVWVVTDQALFRLDPASLAAALSTPATTGVDATTAGSAPVGPAVWQEHWAFAALLPDGARFAPSNLYRDQAGSLWAIGDGGIFRLQGGEPEFFSAANGLSDSQVSCIYHDREGNLWLGTGRGLDKFSGSKFAVYGLPEGLADPGVNAILASRDGSIWLGTNNGIGIIDPGAGAVRMLEGAPELVGRIRHIIEDNAGVVWVAVYGSGLYGWRDGKVVYRFSQADGLAGNRVRALLEAHDGQLYVGTTTGLSIVSPDRRSVRSLTQADGLAFQYVMCLYEDDAGRIWLGSDGSGIQLFQDGAFGRHWNRQSGLAGDVVFRFLQLEAGGDLFITTAGGISRFNGENFFTYNVGNGLPADAIFEIVPDGSGGLWLTSTSGIARVGLSSIDALRSGELSRLDVQFYDKGSGLRDLPMSTAWSAIDTAGGIWFPTQNGAARLDPAAIPRNLVPPPVVIVDSVFIDGREFERSARTTLEPAERKLELGFTALSFVAPEKVQLQYMLEGFDHDWSPLGRKRDATYTNLNPGTYRFKVRAVNNDGLYSSQTAVYEFVKRPWLWQRWWFWLLVGLSATAAFIGLASLIHFQRTRHIRRRLARQEKELELERKALEAERRAKQIETELKNSYSRFVPPEFISILEKSGIQEVQLGDQVQKRMTVMFIDIRSFASISEEMSLADSFNFLNRYLQAISPILQRNGGFIDKYIGDAVMALFPGSSADAVQAGVEIQAELRAFNSADRPLDWPELRVGIGIHCGSLMLGAIGADQRMDVTVISDAVNIASRLEQLNKQYYSALIVSEDVAADPAVRKRFGLRQLDRVRLYGRQQPLTIYEVLEAELPGRAKQIRDTLTAYEAAMQLLQAARYTEAEDAFAALIETAPADLVFGLHKRQAAEYAIDALMSGWDGVVDLGKR